MKSEYTTRLFSSAVERMAFNHVVVGSSPTVGVNWRRLLGIYFDNVSEWLRRSAANRLCFARAGSSPAIVVKKVITFSPV